MSLGVWLSGVTAFVYFPVLVVLMAAGVVEEKPSGWVWVAVVVMWAVVVWLWLDARRLRHRTRTP